MPPRRLRPLTPLVPSPGLEPPPGVRREGIFILPRQPGESAYSYRYRRTVALYGQTPYQRRIFLGTLRGMSTSQARGYRRRGGESESERRNRISLENVGKTVSQVYRGQNRLWLEEHGYTPDTTGMTWTQLMRLAPRLRYMYNETGEGGRVTPAMIYEAVSLEQDGILEPGWAFERLWKKYDDMVAFRQFTDRQPGRESWAEYQAVHDSIPEVAIQFWYYR